MHNFIKVFFSRLLIVSTLSFLLNSIAPAYASQAEQIDFISYQARLKPDLKQQQVQGNVEIRFKILDKNLTQLSLAAPNTEIYSVKGNIVKRFYIQADELKVELNPVSLASDQTYSIVVDYLSSPKKGIKFYSDHLFTNYNTEEWLVSHSDISDRSAVEMWLTVPKDMKVVANGILTNTRTVGENIEYHWVEERERALFTFGFAAGYFKQKTIEYDGIEFHYFYLQSTEDEIDRMFADVPKIYQFFKDKSGSRLQQKNYTFVITDGNSMQEANGFSLVGRNFSRQVLDEPRESWLITHELAHEWWGNAISANSWSDFWLNEGLVQFLVAAYKEQHYGLDEYDREIILFKESILRKLKNSDQLNPVSPQYPISLNDFKSNYRSVAYNKGAYLFHMLRLEIGEVHFWAGLKHYSQTNWEKSVTGRQLQQAFESASGRKLDEFFDTWAYQPQKLRLSAKIKYLNGQLDIHFKQLQNTPSKFHFWLAIGDGQEIKVTKVEMDHTERNMTFSMSLPPKTIWLDYYQYLPLLIETEGGENYLLNNIFNTNSTLTRYWAIKELVESKFCQSRPALIESSFEKIKLMDNTRIINKALEWWEQRCPS